MISCICFSFPNKLRIPTPWDKIDPNIKEYNMKNEMMKKEAYSGASHTVFRTTARGQENSKFGSPWPMGPHGGARGPLGRQILNLKKQALKPFSIARSRREVPMPKIKVAKLGPRVKILIPIDASRSRDLENRCFSQNFSFF